VHTWNWLNCNSREPLKDAVGYPNQLTSYHLGVQAYVFSYPWVFLPEVRYAWVVANEPKKDITFYMGLTPLTITKPDTLDGSIELGYKMVF
jgi:hypothetical protein